VFKRAARRASFREMARCQACLAVLALLVCSASSFQRSRLINARGAVGSVRLFEMRTEAAGELLAERKDALREAIAAYSACVKQMEELEAAEEAADQTDEKRPKKGLLGAESVASRRSQVSSDMEQLRDTITAAIEALAPFNPTGAPLRGWGGFQGSPPEECELGGVWSLEYTDAADATFKRGDRGEAVTFQLVDPIKRNFVNAVNFVNGKGKLRGFRVIVKAKAKNAKEVALSFQRVVLLRKSRFPRLFGKITIPFPGIRIVTAIGRLLAYLRGGQNTKGPGFEMLFLDEDTRIHRSYDGLYFVHSRLSQEPALAD